MRSIMMNEWMNEWIDRCRLSGTMTTCLILPGKVEKSPWGEACYIRCRDEPDLHIFKWSGLVDLIWHICLNSTCNHTCLFQIQCGLWPAIEIVGSLKQKNPKYVSMEWYVFNVIKRHLSEFKMSLNCSKYLLVMDLTLAMPFGGVILTAAWNINSLYIVLSGVYLWTYLQTASLNLHYSIREVLIVCDPLLKKSNELKPVEKNISCSFQDWIITWELQIGILWCSLFGFSLLRHKANLRQIYVEHKYYLLWIFFRLNSP